MAVQSHRDLIVWNKAMDLTVQVYEITSKFPTSERWRLVDQLCRAAASVPANIAEGQGRSSSKDFAHFLAIARASQRDRNVSDAGGATRLSRGSACRADPGARHWGKQDAGLTSHQAHRAPNSLTGDYPLSAIHYLLPRADILA